MRLIAITILLCTVHAWAQPESFWLQPDKYWFAVGESAIVDANTGKHFVGLYWTGDKDRLVTVDHYYGNTSRSLLPAIPPGRVKSIDIDLMKAGTHLVAMRTDYAVLEMEADTFNAYLHEEGLEDVYNIRKKQHALEHSVTERYARCAKLLLQAGNTFDESYKKVTGMPLEIVPVTNPYAAQPGSELVFKVLFQGRPLPFTLVKVWNNKAGNTFVQNIYTQKDGTITTRLSNTGSWMVSCVKMVPSKDRTADWQSYWATFVFGF